MSNGRIKTKKLLIAKIRADTTHITSESFLNFAHDFASSESSGHGSLRRFHSHMPASTIITAAAPKTTPLCSEAHVICGKAPITPANTDPNPKATNKAGSTQQISVEPEVSRASIGKLNRLVFISYFYCDSAEAAALPARSMETTS